MLVSIVAIVALFYIVVGRVLKPKGYSKSLGAESSSTSRPVKAS